MNIKLLTLAFSSIALLAASLPAYAAEFEVKMKNQGDKGMMVFEPDFVKAAVGDTIKFVPADPSHNVEAISGMLPDGVETFKSKPSEGFTLTLSKEGIYGVKCTPHFAMGMIAIIQAGNPVNLNTVSAVKLTGKAKSRFADILPQLK